MLRSQISQFYKKVTNLKIFLLLLVRQKQVQLQQRLQEKIWQRQMLALLRLLLSVLLLLKQSLKELIQA